MMGFCPVRVTLIEKNGKTSILFVKPSIAPEDSKAYAILKQLEAKVISAIDAVK